MSEGNPAPTATPRDVRRIARAAETSHEIARRYLAGRKVGTEAARRLAIAARVLGLAPTTGPHAEPATEPVAWGPTAERVVAHRLADEIADRVLARIGSVRRAA
jgi:hypothetical protein